MSDAPKSFQIEKIQIINSLGKAVDVADMVVRFEIFEDIFSNVLTAQLDLLESLDLPTIYEWHGNEYVFVTIKKPPFDDPEFTINLSFRLYKMGDSEFSETKKRYTLFLCGEELTLSESTRISKSYRKMLISDMVKDIAINHLGISEDKLVISPTSGIHTLIIPNLKPLEAINWLSARALGADRVPLFFFFQRIDSKFYFANIHDLAKQPVFRELWAQNQQQDRELSLIEQLLTYNKAEWIHTFNVLSGINTGAYSGKLHLLDLIGRDYTQVDYSALKDNKISKRFNDWFGFNDAKDKMGNKLFEASGFTSFALTKDFYDDDSFAVDNTIQRASLIAIVSQNRVRVRFPGDPRVTVGKVMTFAVPAVIQLKDRIPTNYSGNYLISAVNHTILPDRYETSCELISDSTGQGFQTIGS